MAIPHSRLFDAEWYLTQNPDVAAAVEAGLITAHDHFSQFGIDENRSPSPLFDPGFYLAQSPDVAAAVAAGHFSAVQHFLLYGQREARAISPFIDLGKYLSANPDVADAVRQGASALDHLLQYGAAEGRDLGNGVNLGVFTDDPAFQAAVDDNDLQKALLRMQEIAPFLPGFQPPAGWAPTPITPIPLDFTPPAGMTLVVPPSVPVPPGMELPPWFQAEQRPAAPPVAPPVSPPADEGYTPPPATFIVNESGAAGSRTLSFGGSATGDITLHIDADQTHLTFSRGGIQADTRPLIADLAPGGITAPAGADMLVMSDTAFSAVQTRLPANISFRVTDSHYSLTDASVSLVTLRAMEEATTGFVDASAVVRTFGTVHDAVHVMISTAGTEGDKISVAPGISVMSLFDGTASSADLKAIEVATTGLVNAQGIAQVSGTVADTLHILETKHGTAGDAISMADNVWVILTDSGSSPGDIEAILNATTGRVTTGLIPGGTYAGFAAGDRINTRLAFDDHTSQATLSNDGQLHWQWNPANHTLVMETHDTLGGAESGSHSMVTYILVGIADVTEAGGIFTLLSGLP